MTAWAGEMAASSSSFRHSSRVREAPYTVYTSRETSCGQERACSIHVHKRLVACHITQTEPTSTVHRKSSTTATVHHILSLGGS
jgi:hypothetical protein